MAIILLIIAGSASGGQTCCGIATDGIGGVLNERQRIRRLVTGCTGSSTCSTAATQNYFLKK